MKKIFIIIFFALINFAQAVEVETLQNVNKLIAQEYINENQLEKLNVLALKSLSKIDENIVVADDNNKITLYYKTKAVKSFLKPEDATNFGAWTDFTQKIITEASLTSDKVAKKDFDVIDIILEKAITQMDKDCHFYPDLNKKELRYKHKATFATRNIDGVLYVKIGNFNKYTLSDLKNALQENTTAKALILDFRGNKGGAFNVAVEVANLFIDGGIIATTHNRDPKMIKMYNATDGDIINAKPIFVLMDKNSASSAELVALALKEQGRAKIIGTNSLGKSTVQDLIVLSNGRGISLSTAKFFSPSGINVNENGVLPDICTFDMLDTKNIANLLEETKTKICSKENREKNNLEIDVALYLLNN